MNKLIDHHNHTDNSEDSQASMSDMCLSAIDKRIDIIAFTEHVDFNPGDEGYLFFNEKKYFNEVKNYQDKYKGELRILKGLEFDEPHLYVDQFQRMINNDYDVILGSVHMIGDMFVGDKSILKRYKLEDLFSKYYEIMLDMVEFGGFDVLAHFDFPKRYYHRNYTENNIVNKILKTIIQNDIALEINTSPLRKGFHECSPDYEILSQYATLGGRKVTIGSDAHAPEDIGADFNYAFKLIKSIIGLEPGYFEKRKFTI